MAKRCLSALNGGGVHADDLSKTVDQRSATVAGINGGIGLDQIDIGVLRSGVDGTAEGADNAPADGGTTRQGQGVANGDNILAYTKVRRGACLRGLETGCVDLDYRHIRVGITAHETAEVALAVMQSDGDGIGAGDHVIVCHYLTIFVGMIPVPMPAAGPAG